VFKLGAKKCFVLTLICVLILPTTSRKGYAATCDFQVVTNSLFTKKRDLEYNQALVGLVKNVAPEQIQSKISQMVDRFQEFSPSFPKEEFIEFVKTQDLSRLSAENKTMGDLLGELYGKFSPEFEKVRESKLASLDTEIKALAGESKRIVTECSSTACVATEAEKLSETLPKSDGFFGCFARHPEAFQNMLKDLAFSWGAMAINHFQKHAKWQDFPFEYMAASAVLGPTIGDVNCRKFYNETKDPSKAVEYPKNIKGTIEKLSSRTWSYMRWYPISAATGSAFSYIADKIRGKKNQSGAYYFWKGVYFMSYSMIEGPIRKAVVTDPLFQKGMPAFNQWMVVKRGMNTVTARSIREATELGARFTVNLGKNYLRAEMNNHYDNVLTLFGRQDLIPIPKPPSKKELKPAAHEMDQIEAGQKK